MSILLVSMFISTAHLLRSPVTDDAVLGQAAEPVAVRRLHPPAFRRRVIMQLLSARGNVTVADLEHEFGISGMTARRDLAALEKEGLALRTYGGAILPASASSDGSFEQRMGDAAEAKARVARAVLDLVDDGDTVFVDSSTTAFLATQALLTAGRKLTVLTNSLPVANLAGASPAVELVVLGGSYQPPAHCCVGPETVRLASSLFADKALISVRGLTSDGRLTDADPLEAEVRRTMIGQARESILLILAHTLDRRGLSTTASLRDITSVVIADISEREASELAKFGPRVHLV